MVCRSWLNRRQINGSLNRTPAGFYDRVWQILERTPDGIIVAGKHLPQVQPTGLLPVKGASEGTCRGRAALGSALLRVSFQIPDGREYVSSAGLETPVPV